MNWNRFGAVLGVLLVMGVGIPQLPWLKTSGTQAQQLVEEQTTIDVYEKASPAVVTISTGRGSGSGSIITAEGLVITNEHVVRTALSRGGQVQVTTTDGGRYTGQVLAVDTQNDLALVQLQANEVFPIIELADPSQIRVGQQVYAIGSPFGLSGTLTTGILSRIAPNGDLQTDASINPGNSGGPLLNSSGQLIGVNKAILSPGRGGSVGIGFATSVAMTQPFITSATASIAAGTPLPGNSPEGSSGSSVTQGHRLGIVVDPQTLIIQQINPGSVASQMGLQAGDRLISLNGQQLSNLDQLLSHLDTSPAQLLLGIGRQGSFGRVMITF